MNKEDYPSDSDENDEDYKPDAVESDVPSEEESDNGEECDDDRTENKKTKGNKSRKKTKTKPECTVAIVSEEKIVSQKSGELNEEEEKKRADALWADFLNDTNTTPTESSKTLASNDSTSSTNELNPCNSKNPTVEENKTKLKITETLEFAGEEVLITKEIDVDLKETINKTKDPAKLLPKTGQTSNLPFKRQSGGISSILGQINKKNKLTVLEKTKLDWDNFKESKGLREELKTHNKGKDGFLDRKDFLERTDLRQFEIEKNLRQTKRSNR